MSVSIKYKGATIASASTDTTKTLKTSGKYCEDDIEVINTQDGGITPSGNINITDTNVTDVTQYATAQVVDADLIADNIKEGVNILGILGTFAGGGGGLPSVISKIDGGSFTLANDTTVNAYKISHNLGVTPKGFIIWCDELDFSIAEATRYLTQMLAASGVYGTSTYKGFYSTLRKNENAANAVDSYAALLSGSNYNNTFSATRIGCILATMKYHANCTYKWLAWA